MFQMVYLDEVREVLAAETRKIGKRCLLRWLRIPSFFVPFLFLTSSPLFPPLFSFIRIVFLRPNGRNESARHRKRKHCFLLRSSLVIDYVRLSFDERRFYQLGITKDFLSKVYYINTSAKLSTNNLSCKPKLKKQRRNVQMKSEFFV